MTLMKSLLLGSAAGIVAGQTDGTGESGRKSSKQIVPNGWLLRFRAAISRFSRITSPVINQPNCTQMPQKPC